jgi:DNA-3-methyladenine glycosylase
MDPGMNETRPSRRFFLRDAETLARALLGHVLVRRLDDGRELAGRIVEVEAYLGAPDRAAHSFGNRRTERNRVMWLEGGHAYVYFTYGMHWCFNVVASRANVPEACLVRALEPLEGLDAMRRRRVRKASRDTLLDTDLCSGPARLTQALGIGRAENGCDLVSSDRLYIRQGRAVPPAAVGVSARIGVGYAGEWASRPLRFFVEGNPHVSVRRARPRAGGRRG